MPWVDGGGGARVRFRRQREEDCRAISLYSAERYVGNLPGPARASGALGDHII